MAVIAPIILSLILIITGIINIDGNISTIHWYNRRKVSKADAPKYGRLMGYGTITTGIAVLLSAIAEIFFKTDTIWLITAFGCATGLIFILYAQFKYNKGIF